VQQQISKDQDWLKRFFFSVKFLGHIVSENGVSIDPEKNQGCTRLGQTKDLKTNERIFRIMFLFLSGGEVNASFNLLKAISHSSFQLNLDAFSHNS
jgi:hypothetical protein